MRLADQMILTVNSYGGTDHVLCGSWDEPNVPGKRGGPLGVTWTTQA